jgi:hypothetical protein
MMISAFNVISFQVPKASAQYELNVFMQPGVADPYNPGFSLTLGTLRTNPDYIVATQNAFSILADSVGDLQFTFTVNTAVGYIRIWVPPEFTFTNTNNARFSVWTDITNDYGYISVSTRPTLDSIAPNWTRITIGRHDASYPGYWAAASAMYTTSVIQPGTYHVRLLGLKAPSILGLYHFKIATDVAEMLVDNWPIIIVKGELNPAFVTGLVESSIHLSGLSGKVAVEGTTPDGRSIIAQAYFAPADEEGTATGLYRYWIFGLPAGSYTMTATASGHKSDTTERFTVNAAQSLHRTNNFWLYTGPAVSVHVFSKHGRGTIPWSCLWQPPFGNNDPSLVPTTAADCATANDYAGLRDILVELYDNAGNKVGFWGSDVNGAWGDQRSMAGTILPTDPTATDYMMNLLDQRGLPSVNWDGHVPQYGADFVAGFTPGTDYNVKTFVTGYVMTDTDAFQRTFTVNDAGTLVEMDLRRSNWFAVTAHELDNIYPMTLAFSAVPTGTDPAPGAEAGLAAIQIPPAPGEFTVVLEGWNGGWPAADPTNDYGINPGTYDIKMYAADQGTPMTGAIGRGMYYIRSDEPFTGSIALCNSPSGLSFRVRPVTLTLALRSIDSEIPSHERPWTFPGAEIWVDFLDSSGNVVASIDPTEVGALYGLVQDDGFITSPWDVDMVHPAGEHSQLLVKWAGINPVPEDVVNVGYYPTRLLPGEYNFQVHTFGYTMRRVFPVWVPDGGNGDIKADLIQGGMFRVGVDFKKQNEYVDFNGFVRVEVYDKDNKLVGANIYGQAQPNYCDTITSTCTTAGAYPDYNAAMDATMVPGPAEGSNIDPDGQRGYLSSQWYGTPGTTWANWPQTDPSDANRLNYLAGFSTAFDVYGFHWYYGGPSSRNDGLWANGWETTDGTHQMDSGLPGSRDGPAGLGVTGGGLYTVKVFAFDPYGPDGVFGTEDDWQSYYADPVTSLELPWGGSQALFVTMNQMGRLSGTATWLDMYQDMTGIPWATVSSGDSFASTTSAIIDEFGLGFTEPSYFLWLPAGTHDVSISIASAPQIFAPASSTTVISDGWSGTYDQTLVPTGVPVPEFPASMLLVMLSALGASVYLLRRKRTVN